MEKVEDEEEGTVDEEDKIMKEEEGEKEQQQEGQALGKRKTEKTTRSRGTRKIRVR